MTNETQTNKALTALNDAPNLKRRVKKSTGLRRRSPNATIADGVAEQLTNAETPAEMGAIALEWGMTVEDVLAIAERAPNWGQFRMVIGNRVRGV